MEVRQQYWQVAVARRRATEQRCFLQGRIGLEKKLHEDHLAKCAKSMEKDARRLTRRCGVQEPNTRLKGSVGIQSATLRGEKLGVGLVVEKLLAKKVQKALEKSEHSLALAWTPRKKEPASVTAASRLWERGVLSALGRRSAGWPRCYTSIAADATELNAESQHSPRARCANISWSRERAASANHAVPVPATDTRRHRGIP